MLAYAVIYGRESLTALAYILEPPTAKSERQNTKSPRVMSDDERLFDMPSEFDGFSTLSSQERFVSLQEHSPTNGESLGVRC